MPLTELADALKVSASTVRRDLEILEGQGTIRRTHGGAVALAEPPSPVLSFADRVSAAATEKKAIALAVARLIGDDQTIIINGGTTCLQVAAALAGRRLSVVTNSVPVAAALLGEVDTEVTLVGGYLYPRHGVALGERAIETLGTLRAAQLVTSCAAVNPDGAFEVNEMMAAVERRMLEVSDQVILAVDHGKIDRRSIARLCAWGEVDVLVTDAGVDEAARQWIGRTGVKLIVAEAPA